MYSEYTCTTCAVIAWLLLDVCSTFAQSCKRGISVKIGSSLSSTETRPATPAYAMRRALHFYFCLVVREGGCCYLHSYMSNIHRVSGKNSQNCFCHNFVKFLLTLIIFGELMATTTKLCKVHSFCTLPNHGSSSPVLTATSLSYGKAKNSTPHLSLIHISEPTRPY